MNVYRTLEEALGKPAQVSRPAQNRLGGHTAGLGIARTPMATGVVPQHTHDQARAMHIRNADCRETLSARCHPSQP